MTENQKLEIKLNLDGELAEKFNVIKERRGLKTDADVVRYLINVWYKTLEELAK